MGTRVGRHGFSLGLSLCALHLLACTSRGQHGHQITPGNSSPGYEFTDRLRKLEVPAPPPVEEDSRVIDIRRVIKTIKTSGVRCVGAPKVVEVRLSVDPSGSITVVDEASIPRPSSDCVQQAFSKAQISPWIGGPFTVRTRLTTTTIDGDAGLEPEIGRPNER